MSKIDELKQSIYGMMCGKYVSDLHLLHKMAYDAKLEIEADQRRAEQESPSELIQKLNNLANRWEQMALSQVPHEYRNLHDKYLRMDNEAAGLSNCAEELRELLNIRLAAH